VEFTAPVAGVFKCIGGNCHQHAPTVRVALLEARHTLQQQQQQQQGQNQELQLNYFLLDHMMQEQPPGARHMSAAVLPHISLKPPDDSHIQCTHLAACAGQLADHHKYQRRPALLLLV
jgi:hypothetical protein